MKAEKKQILNVDSDLSCLFSWAARSSSWMFLVICSVLRMTSSVLGSVGSGSISRSSSSGMELPSPSQPLLLSLPLLLKLQREVQKSSLLPKSPRTVYSTLFIWLSLCQLAQTIILCDALTPNHPSQSHWMYCHSHFPACCFASLTLWPRRKRRQKGNW